MFDYDSIKRRERELEKLREWIEAQLSTDKDVIIVGDMNERLDSSPFAKLNEKDTFYFCTSEFSCDYSYIGIKSLIDHIIVSKVTGGAKVEYLERSIRVFPTDILLKHIYGDLDTLQDRLSDHRLIFGTFQTE
jgi:predicted extracellular nuclease